VSPTSATGNTNTAVSASISGLAAGTTYYFRVSAINGVNPSNGSPRPHFPMLPLPFHYQLEPGQHSLHHTYQEGGHRILCR
jgi:hypothetical protein